MSGTATPIATCRSHMDGFWLSGSRAPSSTCVPAKDTCSSTSDRRRSCAPWPRARSAWRRVGVVTSASSASQAPAYGGVVDRCEECGFDYDLAQAPASGPAVIDGVAEVTGLLGAAGEDLRARQQPSVWSPLEYGCHLRDVLLVQRERVLAARRMDRPTYDPMGRDERVEHDGYAEQTPADVARQLRPAAQLFANVLWRLGPDDVDR